MASMMDEMQKTLARRRAKVDRSSEEPEGSADRSLGSESSSSLGTRAELGGANHADKGGSSSPPTQHIKGSESPRPEAVGGSSELEAMKQEILKEMRKEINKAKLDIIDAIRQELARK